MTKKLFVGGLPYSLTEAEVSEMFAKIGKVTSLNLITDKFTNQSKGFAFVEMEDEDADKAITALNGQDVGGRKIIVNIARPREENNDFRGGYNKGGNNYSRGGRGNNKRY